MRRPVQDQALIFRLTSHHPGDAQGQVQPAEAWATDSRWWQRAAMVGCLTVSLGVCSLIAVAEAVAGQPLSGRRGSS